MIIDDAYFLWFDQDQHRRGMTDYLPDELLEWQDEEGELAPVIVLPVRTTPDRDEAA